MAGGERQGEEEERLDLLHLPMPEAVLFGREEETRWLEACWDEGAHVATIVAPGGVGKSALVHDWLRKMQAAGWREAERVYGWSFYSQGTRETQSSADFFIHEALVFFGDPEPDAGLPADKGERLARLVRKRRVLLVLDGMEPLQWGPGVQEGRIKDPALERLLRRLGESNAGLCVITSRLGVPEVAGFARGKSRKLDLGTLTEEAGEQLLRARGVKGTEKELREAVLEYGGHSLALVLLGSYLADVEKGDIRRRHEIGSLLEGEELGGHARRVMAAYVTMFGERSAEVAVLRMLGLFDRPASEGGDRGAAGGAGGGGVDGCRRGGGRGGVEQGDREAAAGGVGGARRGGRVTGGWTRIRWSANISGSG